MASLPLAPLPKSLLTGKGALRMAGLTTGSCESATTSPQLTATPTGFSPSDEELGSDKSTYLLESDGGQQEFIGEAVAAEGFTLRDLCNCTPESNFALTVSVIAALNSTLLGYDISIMSSANVFIRQELNLSDEQEELESGILNFTGIFGALIAGWLIDYCGRRRSMMLVCSLATVGCLMAALARGIRLLMLGRSVLGLAVGGVFVVVPVYIAEIVPMRMRGFLVSLSETFISVGIFFGFFAGWAIGQIPVSYRWRIMIGLGALPAVAILLLLPMLPETPRWLAFNGRREEALAVIRRTCTTDAAASSFMGEIVESQKMSEDATWRDILFPTRTVGRILLVGLGVGLLQQLTGIEATMYYTPVMLEHAGLKSESTQLALTLVMGFIKLIVSLVAGAFVDKLGRRPMLIVGTLVISLTYVVVAVGYSSGAPVTTVVGIYAFIFGYAASLGPVAWVVISEVFPTRIRGMACALAVAINRGSSALCTFFFLSISDALSPAGLFGVLAAVNVCSAVFLYMLLPESKGKALEEIEQEFAAMVGEEPGDSSAKH